MRGLESCGGRSGALLLQCKQAWNDVVDVKNQKIEGRRKMAILATIECPLPDLPD